MATVFSALMCHAPIVHPAVAGPEAERCVATTRAMREVAARAVAARPDRLVLVSPHSPRRRTGFGAWHGRHRGSLADFRAPQLRVDLPDAPEVSGLLPEVSGPALDHGAMVPLAFLAEAGWAGPTAILALPWEEAGGEALGRTLADLPGRTAVIASGDMSHRLLPGAPSGYHADAHRFDSAFVAALAAEDWSALEATPFRALAAEDVVASTRVAVAAAGTPRNAEVLAYEGPFGVGYAEAIFVDGAPPLYAVARRAIQAALTGRPVPVPEGGPPAAGVFVSLHERGQLRGCIGTIRATTGSLYEETARMAVEAATQDPRFVAVRADELPALDVEVSVLEPPEPVASAAALDPRVYGCIVSARGRRGLLLPDLDGVDTVADQLRICKQKAGLPPDADVRLERFRVRKEARP